MRDIGEARVLFEDYQADPGGLDSASAGSIPVVAPPRWRRLLPWAVAGVAVVAAAVLGVGNVSKQPAIDSTIRFQVPPPEDRGYQLDPYRPGPVVVSPDGQSLAFTAWDADGQARIFVRDLDEVQPRVLAGTDGAEYPFWSPDSKNLGFFADDKLKKVSASGGQPLTLCDAPNGKGGSWSSEGVIVFEPEADRPIQRVSQLGGEPVDVTTFDEERGDNSHRHPRFLPDGQHFLYLARFRDGFDEGHAIVAASLEGQEQKVIIRSPAAAENASGHLLFLRERTLMAQPFDPDALELSGELFPIADTVVLIAEETAQAVFRRRRPVSWRSRVGCFRRTSHSDGAPGTVPFRKPSVSRLASPIVSVCRRPKKPPLFRFVRTRVKMTTCGWSISTANSELASLSAGGTSAQRVFSPDGETVMWGSTENEDSIHPSKINRWVRRQRTPVSI